MEGGLIWRSSSLGKCDLDIGYPRPEEYTMYNRPCDWKGYDLEKVLKNSSHL